MNDYQNLTWEEIGKRFAQTEQLLKNNEKKLMKMFGSSCFVV
jgi:hypothetical protein